MNSTFNTFYYLIKKHFYTKRFIFLFLVSILISVNIIASLQTYFRSRAPIDFHFIKYLNSVTGISEEAFTGISPKGVHNNKYALIDYCIKSSWQSAYDGYSSNTVSLSSIKRVLDRGCRWIDLEIFVNNQDELVVGVSFDKNTETSNTSNTLPLIEVLETIHTNAFVNSNSSLNNDPLFIQIRIQSSQTNTYPFVGSYFKEAFGNYLYVGPKIDPTKITLKQLTKKVILVLDIQGSNQQVSTICDDSYVNCNEVKSLHSICGILLGTYPFAIGSITKMMDKIFYDHTKNEKNPINETKKNISIDHPMIKPKGNRITTAKTFKLIFPDLRGSKTKENPDPSSFLSDHVIQVLPTRFHIDDDGLAQYELIFENHGNVSFLPLSTILSL